MWDLPGPGLEPVSPALAGGFLTTEPPRTPVGCVLMRECFSSSSVRDRCRERRAHESSSRGREAWARGQAAAPGRGRMNQVAECKAVGARMVAFTSISVGL